MKRLSTVLLFVAALLSVGTAEAKATGDACERFLSRISSSAANAAAAAVPNEEIGAASARVAAACNDAKEEEEEAVCGALRDQKVLAQILAALSAGHTTPRRACRLLLGDDDQTQLLRSNNKRAETAKCEVCKLVVKGAEAVLTDETTDKEIERELERLCRVFGAQEDVCDEFVEFGLLELVAMLRGKFTPDVVCSKVHLCN